MKDTKILFISRAYPPIVGGVENQNYELSLWLSKIATVKIIANKKGKKFLPFFLPYATIIALLNLRNNDVVVLGDGVLALTGWIIKLFSSKPVICVIHGLDLTFPQKIYQKIWVAFFMQKIDKFIAVGNETIRVAVEHGIKKDKCVFIPNGVDSEKFIKNHSRENLEEIIKINTQGKKILLTSGRLAKRKGVAWFISNVMPKLSDDFIYIIAGNGPDKENIAASISKNNLDKRVIMLGYVTDPVRDILLNTADLFLQPNIKIPGDMEGFGISVIEAGSCALPVLASDIEGLKDAIKNGCNGFLVQSENADQYVEKINELFQTQSPRTEYGQKIRDYVKNNYSWENISKLYLSEIEKTLTKK